VAVIRLPSSLLAPAIPRVLAGPFLRSRREPGPVDTPVGDARCPLRPSCLCWWRLGSPAVGGAGWGVSRT